MVFYLTDVKFGSSCAPSVLIFFIDMMLFKTPEYVEGCNRYMFDGQELVQYVLVFGSLACIPVLLLGRPLFIKCTRKNKPHVNCKKCSFGSFDVRFFFLGPK
jgi:V-type H+-transporting ATPase subunit a